MNDVEKLLAIEEIKTVFARRVRYLDTKQWDLYGTVHTEDARSESYGDLPVNVQPVAEGARNLVIGPQALAAAIRAFVMDPVPMTTVHHAHPGEIEILSDDCAMGIWPMEDWLWWEEGDRKEWFHGFGHYHERYRKEGGCWLISYRKLTRIKTEKSPGFYDRQVGN